MKPEATPWQHVVGVKGARVVVYEDPARKNVLTLRWRDKRTDNWRRKVLGKFLERDRRGNIRPESESWAINEANRKSVALTDGTDAPVSKARPFLIGQTKDAITHAKTGAYPHSTPFVKELSRALDYACLVWGKATPWTAIDDGDWARLIRQRLEALVRQEKAGVRTTQITVSRLITATRWLRRRKLIPQDAALAPDDWRATIVQHWKGETGATRDPQAFQPRYSLEEMRAILKQLGKIEPRVGLLITLGAEYRLGQVVRARRSDLDVEHGRLTIYGNKHKSGETIDLTTPQLAAATQALGEGGYLADLEAEYEEAETDYLLFPGGRMTSYRLPARTFGKGARLGTPMNSRTILKHFRTAETLAKVDYVKGRGPYGMRRQNVDAALASDISAQGLKASGGWRSTKIPTEIYAEKENQTGRAEAKRIRSKTRGETPE